MEVHEKKTFYGADHESIRVQKKIDACKCCRGGYDGPAPTVVERCTACIQPVSIQPRPAQAQTEHQRMMRELVRCPLYERTYTLDVICTDDSTSTMIPSTPLLLSSSTIAKSTNPYIRYDYRTYDRISGIEEIADTVRGIASSEITTRRRRIQEYTGIANSALRRHAEHFRVTPPPDPRLCRPRQIGPQPGVPIAPTTPCNLGNQRVDYSDPTS